MAQRGSRIAGECDPLPHMPQQLCFQKSAPQIIGNWGNQMKVTVTHAFYEERTCINKKILSGFQIKISSITAMYI